MGGILGAWILVLWRDSRACNHVLRADVRADIQARRTDVRADLAEVRGDLAGLRKDVQALSERPSRVEGVIEGFFGRRDPGSRHDDA